MKRRTWLAFGLVLAMGATAATVTQGSKLYIKTRNTRLMPDTKATSAPLAVLQPGDEVTWLGVASDKRWHKVQAGKHKGLVLFSNLSVAAPRMEITSTTSETTTDAASFLSSGAATKALGQGAIAYGKEQGMQKSVDQLTALEALAHTVTPADLDAHARHAGLLPAVGPKATARGSK